MQTDADPAYALYRLYGEDVTRAFNEGQTAPQEGVATTQIEDQEEAAEWARLALQADDARLGDTIGEESVKALRQVAALPEDSGDGPQSFQSADPETREKMSLDQKVDAIRRDVADGAMGNRERPTEPSVPPWSEIAHKERSNLTVSQKVKAIEKDESLGE